MRIETIIFAHEDIKEENGNRFNMLELLSGNMAFSNKVDLNLSLSTDTLGDTITTGKLTYKF